MREICRRPAARASALIGSSGASLFVNLTPTAFVTGRIECIHALSQFPPDRVVVELTQSRALGPLPSLEEAAAMRRKEGYRLAVDDIAAGHSRLLCVAALAPKFVKTHKEVVRTLDRPARRAVVEGALALSRGIGAQGIAEGSRRDRSGGRWLRRGSDKARAARSPAGGFRGRGETTVCSGVGRCSWQRRGSCSFPGAAGAFCWNRIWSRSARATPKT